MSRPTYILSLFICCSFLLFTACKNDTKSFFKLNSAPAPTLSAVSPTTGSALGGSRLVLKGANFDSASTVSVGTGSCTSVSFVSSTELNCISPPSDVGVVSVTVSQPSGLSSTLQNAFTYYLLDTSPVITSISPAVGPLTGGNLLQITGTGFVFGAEVTVGDKVCTNAAVSPTVVICTVPAASAGIYDVVVINPDKQSFTYAKSYTYQGPPTLTQVSPIGGPLEGGTTITLTGTSFRAGASILVGGGPCTNTAIVSSTSATCTTPPHLAGSVDVYISNTDSQAAGLVNGFSYEVAPTITSLSPSVGALAGGTTITITGTGFLSGATASINGAACTSPSVSSLTRMTCLTPAQAAGTYSLIVTNLDGQSATLSNAYTYQAAPTITSVSPNGGPLAGGTVLTITGTRFQSGATVLVGGNSCTGLTVTSTQITCTTPSGTVGAKNVTVTNTDSQSAVQAGGFSYQAAPVITSVSPSSGVSTGGTLITLTGTGFLSGAILTLNGSACTSVTVTSSTQITCSTPAHAAGVVDIVITNFDSQSGTLANSYTYVSSPTIASVSPPAGPLVGGTAITLTGTGFRSGASVLVGGNTCSGVSVVSATQITCTTAAHAGGAVDVTVTNSDSQSGTLVSGFTYGVVPTLTSITPTAGALAGGTTITLTGTDFQSGATITVGSSTCTSPSYVSPTQLTCVTPAKAAGLYSIVVTNPDTQTATLSNAYTYQAGPAVTSISPNAGSIAGGTSVTIQGSAFLSGATVSIGGASCSISLTTPTQISCVTGVNAAGVKDVTVTNPDSQVGSLVNGYTYQPAPTVNLVSASAGALAGGNTVTVYGSNFVSGLSVYFDSTLCNNVVVVDSGHITCRPPAHVAGTVDVTVINADTQFGSAVNIYTYQAAPTLSSISPIAGPLAGNTVLTLTGTGFLSGATVSVGGNTCQSPTLVSSTSLTCSTPSNLAGTYPVALQNSDGQTATLLSAFTYNPAPTVSSVTPNAGALLGGTAVTIGGTGFLASAAVTFGGVSCTSIVVTSNSITCSTPAKTAGVVDVVITNTDNQAATLSSGYTYQPAPTLTSLTPISGSTDGGTLVTLTGTGFVSGAGVSFGGTACTAVSVSSSTSLSCTTAARAAGTVAVTITNSDNQASNTLLASYTYLAPPLVSAVSPVAGALAGGTTLTLSGSAFRAGATVTVGGSVCSSPVVVSATQVTCSTPPHSAGTYDVVLTNTDGLANTLTNAYTYQAAPQITSLSPSSGFLYGNYTLTITGTGFQSGASVSLGSNACSSISVDSTTQITCTAPTVSSAGAVNVVVTNTDSQVGSLNNGFNYTTNGFTRLDTLSGPLGNSNTDGTGTLVRMSESTYGITNDGTYLYIADSEYCVVRKLNITTLTATTLAGTPGNCVAAAAIEDGTGLAASFSAPYSIVYANSYLYIGDAYTIRQVDPSTGVVSTVAGSAGATGTTDAVGTNARFGSRLYGITTDGSSIYISDSTNQTIRKMVISNFSVSTLAGTAGVAGNNNAVGTLASFSTPRGIVTDGTTLYVADSENNLIRAIVVNTGSVSTLLGTGEALELDGIGTAAKLNAPYSTYLSGGYLYIIDYGGQVVRKANLTTLAVTTITGKNAKTRNDIGTAAYFASPLALTGDGTYLYVTDKALASVRRIRMSNTLVTSLVGPINQFGLTNGASSSALFYQLYQPTSVGTTLYVPDNLNCEIRSVDVNTGRVDLFAGNAEGVCSSVSANGTGGNAYFFNPQAVTTDGSSYLYVADGRTIRQIELDTGYVSILTGQLSSAGAQDGNSSVAQFGGNTYGIVTDGTYLYVSDYENHAIRKVTIASGLVATLAGSLGNSGTTNDTGTNARFNHPRGLALSADRLTLYVADTGNCSIRQVTLSSGTVTTLAGLSGTCGSTNDTGGSARFQSPTALTSDGTRLYAYDSTTNVIRQIDIASGVVTDFLNAEVNGNRYQADIDGVVAASNVNSVGGLYWSSNGFFVMNKWNVRRFH